MLLRDTQSTFGKGEISPALWGRTDIQSYKTSLKTGRNINIIPQGGFRNRPGTAFSAMVGIGTSRVRLIPFIAATNQAYVIELGQNYARFYTNDGQVQATAGGAYQISTPWAASDLFSLRFAQSADVMYFAHPSYAPQTLTFNAPTNWVIAAFAFVNGPFRLQNTVQGNTITPSAPLWITATAYLVGQFVSIPGFTAADLIDNFSEGNYNAWTVTTYPFGSVSVASGFINIAAPASPGVITAVYTALAQSYGSFSAAVGNFGFFFFGMSSNAVNASGVPTGTGYSVSNVNGTVTLTKWSGGTATTILTASGFSVANHYICVFRASANGAFTLYVDGVSSGSHTDNTYSSGAYIFLGCQAQYGYGATYTQFTNIYYDSNGSVAANTTANGGNYVCLVSHTSGTFATDLGNGDWILLTASQMLTGTVNLTSISAQFVAGHVGSLWLLTNTLVAQTITDAGFTSNSHASTSIQCGATWSIITLGAWTGKILVQVSIDNGVTWQTVQTLQSAGSSNYETSGSTGFSQCLLRVTGDGVTTWSGTLTIDLTANSFDWNQVVQILSVTSANVAVATVVPTTEQGVGLPFTATYQWSEGSWSTYRGWPTCVTFYQDRSAWASTPNSEPNTIWHSKTSSYADFGVSEPIEASDGFSVVLSSRQLNAVSGLVPMPQAMIVMTSDSSFGLAPGSDGSYSETDIQQLVFDHRGAYNLDPVVVGNEIILVQQMGTVIRNLIFQLAVNGFMGDNISVSSQHLFTGYSLVQMAYQQEPDSIIWAVRNDGELLSCTYDRGQEMNAWTHHDTQGGLFESVACIPNPTLGINEIWVVVNRGGNRTVEILKPRDQGTVPSAQWFVDCGTQYSGAPATVISGIPSFLNGQAVAVYADGFVISNGVTDQSFVVQNGQITLSIPASVVTVGIPIVWDACLLDIESPNQSGSLQGRRVTQPRGKIRCWNSRSGYISLSDPASSTGLATVNGGSYDAIQDLMNRDPSVDMDTPLPLVTSGLNGAGLCDVDFPGDYSYGSHVCIRGVDPVPFTLLDVVVALVPGDF